MKFAIVVSDFNKEITSPLLEGAMATLKGVDGVSENIFVAHVPGTYEIPLVAKKLALTKKYDAIIALGCVIRGETIHFEIICRSTLDALQKISLETGIPITSGIVMAENENQAWERSGGPVANRGSEAARAALQMVEALKLC